VAAQTWAGWGFQLATADDGSHLVVKLPQLLAEAPCSWLLALMSRGRRTKGCGWDGREPGVAALDLLTEFEHEHTTKQQKEYGPK
jgi:hypothetical protein